MLSYKASALQCGCKTPQYFACMGWSKVPIWHALCIKMFIFTVKWQGSGCQIVKRRAACDLINQKMLWHDIHPQSSGGGIHSLGNVIGCRPNNCKTWWCCVQAFGTAVCMNLARDISLWSLGCHTALSVPPPPAVSQTPTMLFHWCCSLESSHVLKIWS